MSNVRTGLTQYTYLFEGTVLSPTTKEMVKFVRDESINMDTTEVEGSNRGGGGIRTIGPGLSNGSIEGQILYTPEDPVWEKLRLAHYQKQSLLAAFLDGPWQDGDQLWGETGTVLVSGWLGAYYVTNFSQERNLEDVVVNDIRFSPTLEAGTLNPPRWLKDDSVTITGTASQGLALPQSAKQSRGG